MECMFERALINMGFVVIKDGSIQPTDVDWLSKPTFFTRVLRAKVDGHFVNTWVKFTYDMRTGNADFSVSSKDMTVFEAAVAEAAERAEVEKAKPVPVWRRLVPKFLGGV
jgi:hypothetical protein